MQIVQQHSKIKNDIVFKQNVYLVRISALLRSMVVKKNCGETVIDTESVDESEVVQYSPTLINSQRCT